MSTTKQAGGVLEAVKGTADASEMRGVAWRGFGSERVPLASDRDAERMPFERIRKRIQTLENHSPVLIAVLEQGVELLLKVTLLQQRKASKC
jgi:hypothetical protein